MRPVPRRRSIPAGAAGNPISLTVNVAGPPAASPTRRPLRAAARRTRPWRPIRRRSTGAPVLGLAKSHTGNFTAGQTGTYSLVVSNCGNVATSGTITVTDTLPVGLTYNSASGTGWTCGGSGQNATCTSTTVIAAGSTSPNTISLVVNVAPNAPASVTNSASASGGGASNAPVATDPTTIVSPVLAIAKSHTGNFTAGQTGTYTISVSNTGTAPTSGTLTVTDTLPAGLTYNAASGTGWSCSGSGNDATCTSTTVIAAGANGNPISLTVTSPPTRPLR